MISKTKNTKAHSFVLELDHFQLAMPKGQEAAAEAFYSGILGFERIPKPANLEKRGGCWFRSNNVSLHLGVEAEFKPAKKSHPGFLVKSLTELMARLKVEGVTIVDDEPLSGYHRFYAADPFGNRLEFMEPRGGSHD